jgi:hypothetical protein
MKDTAQELWAVSIAGPDDLVPVASYSDAMRLANSFNEWWRNHINSRGGLHKFDPRMWATPVVYTGAADQHAESVANPSEDYAPFLEAPADRVEKLQAALTDLCDAWEVPGESIGGGKYKGNVTRAYNAARALLTERASK